MNSERPLDPDKVRAVFGRLATDKRRLVDSGLSRLGVPSYVAEWILDEIIPGVGPIAAEEERRLRTFVDRALPRRNEQQVYKNRLLSAETLKLLTYLTVEVNITRSQRLREAKLPALGLSDCIIPDTIVDQHKDLLRQGMWGIVELLLDEDGVRVVSFKPMQSQVNLELLFEKRKEFNSEEWQQLIVMSVGYNPLAYTKPEQIYLMARLLPLVQRNMHLMELAPKGTGKSFIYENISPMVRLISGGSISPAVLFVNNATGQEGLLARFNVVVLDEVQKIKFEKPEEIVGVLKGYLANGRITRGGKVELSSDCGLVLLANIPLDEGQAPYSELLVDNLSEFLQETAFLDRFRGIIPGWKLPKFRDSMIARSIGLKSDFFSETLSSLRCVTQHDDFVRRHLRFPEEMHIRDREPVVNIASGLMKLQYPHLQVTLDDFEYYCVRPAVEMRQLIRNQLYILDAEYRQTPKELAVEVVCPNESSCPHHKLSS